MKDKLEVKIKYTSERNNIIDEFYTPVIANSLVYKRAVGYFTSKILLEYITGLLDFYKNEGKMFLIISPHLYEEDIKALGKGNYSKASLNEDIQRRVESQLMHYLNSSELDRTSTELFFLLIVNGILEVKIAVPKNQVGLFHEKIGIFHLKNSEKIAIIGSNNETYSSVSINHESFNTFCSWKEGQNEYILDHEEEFDQYWSNNSKNLDVLSLDEAFINECFIKIKGSKSIEGKIEEINSIQYKPSRKKLSHLDFSPYDYQEIAANKLLENKGGVLEFATGSGKTKTAIYFMELLKEERSKNFFLIVLPDKTLLEQWHREVSAYNINVLKCYSDNQGWLSDFRQMIDIYLSPNPTTQVVLTTNQTMFSRGKHSKFLKYLRLLNEDFILIVDELHNWSTKIRTELMPNATYKVGLSATPYNFPMTKYDEKLDQHFKGIISTFTLEDAIEKKRLVPYNYYPIFVTLSEEEENKYKVLSQKIAQLQSMLDSKYDKEIEKNLELLRFQRSRVVYGAINKIHKLGDYLNSNKIPQNNLIIYCGATSYDNEEINEIGVSVEEDALTQLQTVNNMLNDLGIQSAQYTQAESREERLRNIDLFTKGTMSTLSAIKCLDEGVDIPQIENAVILASSSNKREFIQRRGRVLRKSDNKTSANIYDFVVIDNHETNSHLNKIERLRVLEFAKLALNYEQIFNENKEYFEGEVYTNE